MLLKSVIVESYRSLHNDCGIFMKTNDIKLIVISRRFSSFSAVHVNELKNKSTGNAGTVLKQRIL